MRNLAREDLFERWLTEVVRVAGPYDDYETFAHFSERIKNEHDGTADTPGVVSEGAGDQGGATKPAR